MTPQRRAEFRMINIGGELTLFDGLDVSYNLVLYLVFNFTNLIKLIQDNSTRWNSFFMSIGRAINVRERIDRFCDSHVPTKGSKGVDKDRLGNSHWMQLQHLHDQLETFYEATLDIQGRNAHLSDHFSSLDWLLQEIHAAKQKYEELAEDPANRRHRNEYRWLASCAECAWNKCEKYYNKADESAAYYASIVLNPTLKLELFRQWWYAHPEKGLWLELCRRMVKELWLEEYKGQYSKPAAALSDDNGPAPQIIDSVVKAKNAFTSLKAHKRLKLTNPMEIPRAEFDELEQYLETNLVSPPKEEYKRFDCINYWIDRLTSSPDLARFALDMLAIPPMSDEAERVFSAAKILLSDRRSRLKMDIIEANECLRHWYGPPPKGTFSHTIIGVEQGEEGYTPQELDEGNINIGLESDDEIDIRDDELEGIDKGFIPGESIDISEEEDD